MKVTRVSSSAFVLVMVRMMSSDTLSPASYRLTLLSASLALPVLICPMVLCHRDCHYPCFSDEEAEAQRGYVKPEVTQLVSGGLGFVPREAACRGCALRMLTIGMRCAVFLHRKDSGTVSLCDLRG